MMQHQIADSHPHVVQDAVGQARRNRQPQRRVNHAQRKDVSVAPKHFAEEQRP